MRIILGIFALLVIGQVLYGLREAVYAYSYENYRIIGLVTLLFGAVLSVMVMMLLGLFIYERILKIRRENKKDKGFYL